MSEINPAPTAAEIARANSNAVADGGGSGSGSGSGPGPAPTPTPTPAGMDAILRATDNVAAAVGAITSTGATVAQAVAAALDANGSPAPADPLAVQLAGLHTRMTAIEETVNTFAAIFGEVVPGSKPITSRVAELETAVEQTAKFAETTAPLFSRVLSAFNIHFGGKI